jgi:two-component system chemotaxis sensor kinase CheA
LVALERNPPAQDILASIFRAIHTIKGTSGFLAFSKLEVATHVGENLLSRLRDGHFLLNGQIASCPLAMLDAVRQMLLSIETTGKKGDGDYTRLIEALTALQKGQNVVRTMPLRSAPSSPAFSPSRVPVQQPGDGAPPKDRGLPVGEILVRAGKVQVEEVAEALKLQAEGDSCRLGEILAEL